MQLHAASARGDLDGMAFALKNGADINDRNAHGQTALIFALEEAKAFAQRRGPLVTVEAVQFLLDAGADFEATDCLGNTAIHHAVATANPAFLDLILANGGNARHVTTANYSTLLHACFQPAGQAKRLIVHRLFTVGASMDAASDHGEFPLGVCLYFGDLETMRLLLDLGADPGPLHWTPLHHAVAFGRLFNLEQAAPTPAEINAVNDRFELSPWLLAFVRGSVVINVWLAEHGANLTQVGRCGESLAHLAARFGHVNLLHWLFHWGADANAMNRFGDTPLHEASTWNQVECASALIRAGANARLENEVQTQPIHAAKSLEIIQTLVELGGADVNVVNGCGEWPLKMAAEENDVSRLEWLLGKGAKVDLTSTGETALHAAVGRDAREAVQRLLAAGADPNNQDVDGWSPLCCAQSREVIRTLLQAGADPRITDQIGWGPEQWLKDPILVKALRDKK